MMRRFVFLLCPLLLVLLSDPCGASPPPPTPPPPPLTQLSPTDIDDSEVSDIRPNISDLLWWEEEDKAARCATTSGFDPLVASASAPRGDTNMRPVGAFLVGDIVSQRLVLVWVSTWSAHSLSTRSCGYRMCSRVVPPPPPSTWTHWWIRSQPCPLHRLRRRMPTGQRVHHRLPPLLLLLLSLQSKFRSRFVRLLVRARHMNVTGN